jgi:class 3 adenylate cyclase/tetratricopeptide (TPR) repeat protein
MRCPRCSADNSAGMRFCGQCGAPLGADCPSCGAGTPPESRFCGQCGAALDRPGLQEFDSPAPYLPKSRSPGARNAKDTRPGEMKQVSVLFCDIVNSTAMTERLGAEAMRDLVSSFLKESLAEVHRYGGTAPQFTGDGFMALFGAPLAYEDHVRRCLLAALAIQRTLGGDASGREQLELPVRIGIHTGPVVFGPLGEKLPMGSTAIGDAANVAARLQEAAEPGTILLSEATRRLARGFARLESVGPLVLKGKDDPVVAYRLLRVSHRRSGLRETGSDHPTTFVDRHSELAILNNFLRQVEGGRSQAVGVVGEPGIGKSRLLVEFHQQLAPGRVTWVEGRCVSYGTAIPYWLVLDLLRSHCGILESDTPEAITGKVGAALEEVGMNAGEDSPVLLHLLGITDGTAGPALSSPEAVKAKTFDVFRRLWINSSQRRPLVMVLEDLHWVNKTSEELFGFLAENAPDARILMLATYRPGYRPPWIDKSYAGQAPLQPLSRDDSLQVVRSMLSGERLVDLVSEEIVAKADGNPFFIEQLALHVGEARDVRSDLMVPDSIHDVVMARIDRLPDGTKQLLQTAAVIGREFSSRLLSAVWNDPGTLENRLRELSRLEFISERAAAEETVYAFRHALTQEAAYGSLLERHRRSRHGAVGGALEQLYAGRTEEVAELLALHFGRSDEAEKAVEYTILAAEKSQRRWAHSEALAYFDEARKRLEHMSDTQANRLRRIDAVLKQADVRYDLNQYNEYLKILEDIRDLVEQTDDAQRSAVWHYWTGLLHSLMGSPPRIAIEHCIEHCNEAVRIAAAQQLQETHAVALSCLAQVYIVAGRLRDAVEAGERALAYFEARGDHWWASRTLWFLNIAASYLANWRAAVDYSRRGLDHGAALGNPLSRSVLPVCWVRMGWAYIHQGDVERGLQCCEEALAFAPMLPRYGAIAKAARGHGLIKAGRFEAGFAELRDALAWLHRHASHFSYVTTALPLAEGYLRQGDTASARPLIQEIYDASKAGGYSHIEGRACWLMAEYLAGGNSAAAEDFVERAMLILERVGARNDLAKAMLTRAALRQRAGDIAATRELLERASMLFSELGTLDEPARVEAALVALDRGSPIALLAGAA